MQCSACDGRLPSDSQQPPYLAGLFGVSDGGVTRDREGMPGGLAEHLKLSVEGSSLEEQDTSGHCNVFLVKNTQNPPECLSCPGNQLVCLDEKRFPADTFPALFLGRLVPF